MGAGGLCLLRFGEGRRSVSSTFLFLVLPSKETGRVYELTWVDERRVT